jgi:hypothetical protein
MRKTHGIADSGFDTHLPGLGFAKPLHKTSIDRAKNLGGKRLIENIRCRHDNLSIVVRMDCRKHVRSTTDNHIIRAIQPSAMSLHVRDHVISHIIHSPIS